MERGSNSEANVVTNSEKANILRARDALREIIPGKCQLFDMLPNFYATNSPLRARQPADNIAQRAKGYVMPGIRVDGNDVLAVFRVAREAVKRARNGDGPTLIECRTYRWMQHVDPYYDYELGCRPKEELAK